MTQTEQEKLTYRIRALEADLAALRQELEQRRLIGIPVRHSQAASTPASHPTPPVTVVSGAHPDWSSTPRPR